MDLAALSRASLLILLTAGLLPQDAGTAAARDEVPVAAAPDGERATPEVRLEDLAFLSGAWRGGDGQSTWESWYSTPDGGQLVGASKELRGGRVVTIDFEHFRVEDGRLCLTPYPYGNRSVTFTLAEFSAGDRRAVFANEQHDFPQRFTYHRVAEDRLDITLEGDMGGGPVSFTIELSKQAGR